jgi:hypothetical protein
MIKVADNCVKAKDGKCQSLNSDERDHILIAFCQGSFGGKTGQRYRHAESTYGEGPGITPKYKGNNIIYSSIV